MNDEYYGRVYGLTDSDRHTYGAEDMQELVSILSALDRESGVEQDSPWRSGRVWERAMTAPRRRMRGLLATGVPREPGVLVFFEDGRPVYVGTGAGKTGLRGRMRQHLATGTDLSSSTLRASVAVDVLGISRWTARQRPSVLLQSMVDEVNEVMAELEVAWIICSDADESRSLKDALWSEYKPEYNIL
ncbi:hypothetical protein MUN74_12115 [Agromyces endophyticus]|uniref:hypothetical protein n=1 Tax=Agromyces sp. H17E-10 TaxID=2932244 RepID=UPI001FD17564|nr:hypothetical protein [Agromyces sp. H17E-10]UOQ88038.1 hypothetical protein MUN74_12115 [Agromyces sp. H17E-10]